MHSIHCYKAALIVCTSPQPRPQPNRALCALHVTRNLIVLMLELTVHETIKVHKTISESAHMYAVLPQEALTE